MDAKMRAKLRIHSVTQHEGGSETLELGAVASGTPEDNTYSKYTPSANLKMSITNPALAGQFKPGQTFYVDFTPAD